MSVWRPVDRIKNADSVGFSRLILITCLGSDVNLTVFAVFLLKILKSDPGSVTADLDATER